MPRTRQIGISIGSLYVGLTVVCGFAYEWSGMSAFDAIVHAMTTLSTGGMGNYDASFAPFSPAAEYVSIAFMLIGAMSFSRYIQIARGEARAAFADTQMRSFLCIYAAFALALLASRLMEAQPLAEPVVREVLFNLASVITTTGYASTDYSLWGPLAWTLIFCVMMICGCSGSTAGGPKVFRYELLFAAISAEVRRLYSPSVVFNLRYQGRPVSPEVIDSVMAFFLLFFLTLGTGTVLLVLLGLDPVTAITGVATCLSNVGPGLGPEIGPAGNFVSQPAAAKWVFSFLMLAGRLEVMTVYALFTVAFWRG
jgi:trk system potassium uptake protein TrkH